MPGSRRHADELFFTALACGATVENAARTAGISARTATRRLAEPGAEKRVQRIRSEMVQRTAGTLTAILSEAVKSLHALLQPSVSANARLGAIRTVLEMVIKFREDTDLTQRIEALEENAGLADQGK